VRACAVPRAAASCGGARCGRRGRLAAQRRTAGAQACAGAGLLLTRVDLVQRFPAQLGEGQVARRLDGALQRAGQHGDGDGRVAAVDLLRGEAEGGGKVGNFEGGGDRWGRGGGGRARGAAPLRRGAAAIDARGREGRPRGAGGRRLDPDRGADTMSELRQTAPGARRRRRHAAGAALSPRGIAARPGGGRGGSRAARRAGMRRPSARGNTPAAHVNPAEQHRRQLARVLLARGAQGAVAADEARLVELGLAMARQPNLPGVGQAGLADLRGRRRDGSRSGAPGRKRAPESRQLGKRVIRAAAKLRGAAPAPCADRAPPRCRQRSSAAPQARPGGAPRQKCIAAGRPAPRRRWRAPRRRT
jgi:hypothetical protein